MSEHYVAAIDQGTASSRCMVFDRSARIVSIAQKEHRQVFPRPGWVEHDPEEIWRNVEEVVRRRAGQRAAEAVRPRGRGHRQPARVDARLGARERRPGAQRDQLAGHAHRRAGARDRRRRRPGPLRGALWPAACRPTSPGPSCAGCSTRVPGLRERAEAGDVLFGTDGLAGSSGSSPARRHLTDVTNASRTMLMSLETLDWDDDLLDAMGVPRGDAARDPPVLRGLRRGARAARRRPRGLARSATSRPRSSARRASRPARPSAPTGPAASCSSTPASVRCSRANGLLTDRVLSHRLRATDVCPRGLDCGHRRARAVVPRQHHADRARRPRSRPWPRTVDDNGGCYFVPAFSGLFAPHWRSDARGVIAGLTGYITKGHLARAVLEATAWQTREVVEAMDTDARMPCAPCASTAA